MSLCNTVNPKNDAETRRGEEAKKHLASSLLRVLASPAPALKEPI